MFMFMLRVVSESEDISDRTFCKKTSILFLGVVLPKMELHQTVKIVHVMYIIIFI